MLGGLYPGLYALSGGATVVVPPELPFETVTSEGMTVRLLATASAIDCRSLVTSLFVELTASAVPTPTPASHLTVRPGVRTLVTSTVVEGWKNDG